MQSKIESRSDYESKIKKNPIELLKAIKQHALNYQEHRYEMSIIADSLKTMLNLRQKENEHLQEYTKRFKTARDVLVSHLGGPLIIRKYMKTMPGYDENDKDKINTCAERAFKQLTAFLYLDNADKAKYGSLMTHLSTQKSLGNNQYPKSLAHANTALGNHRFDHAKQQRNHTSNNNKQDSTETSEIQNTEKDAPNMTFAQLRVYATVAGRPGTSRPSAALRTSRERNGQST